MHVEADFSPVQMRETALEHIHRQSFVGEGAVPGGEDIVVDAAREQGRLDRHVLGIEIQAEVSLQAVFGLQVLVSHLVTEGSFVLAVGAQFGQIRGPETAGQVGAEREMVTQGPDSAQARADAREMPVEGLEPACQRIATQPADIGPDTSGKRPCTQGFRGGGKEAGIQEAVGRNQVLVPQVVALLRHAGHAESRFPVFAQGSLPTEVVIQRIEAEVETRFVRRLLEFLPAVLLPAEQELHVPATGMERIVRNDFIMPYLLEWQDGRVAIISPLPFDHARGQVEIAETEPRIAPGGIPA